MKSMLTLIQKWLLNPLLGLVLQGINKEAYILLYHNLKYFDNIISI